MPHYTKEDVAKLVKDLGADDVGVPEGVEIGCADDVRARASGI